MEGGKEKKINEKKKRKKKKKKERAGKWSFVFAFLYFCSQFGCVENKVEYFTSLFLPSLLFFSITLLEFIFLLLLV